MKNKNIQKFRLLLAMSGLASIIFLLFIWPIQTIIGLIVLGKIIENWEDVLAFIVICSISLLGGLAMIRLIHLIFTGESSIDFHTFWGIGWLFTTIYAFGLLIDESNRVPYIWLWQQLKKLAKSNKLAIN